jgi:hypothetical protein
LRNLLTASKTELDFPCRVLLEKITVTQPAKNEFLASKNFER